MEGWVLLTAGSVERDTPMQKVLTAPKSGEVTSGVSIPLPPVVNGLRGKA